MHEHEIKLSESELEMLERVRLQYGLRDLDDTAEFLAKRLLRWQMKQITGRGRAMYLVSPERTEE